MTSVIQRRNHISELQQPGDYVVTRKPDGTANVVLNCPVCGVRMFCPHVVVCEEPLTLSPSVVGPQTAWDKVQGPCGHHYFISNGKVQ